jgi:tetratricopeptide (TPR) repeat protein
VRRRAAGTPCAEPDKAAGACVQALQFVRWGSGQPPLDPVVAGVALGTLAHALRVKGELGEAAATYMRAIQLLRDHPGEEFASVLSNSGALQSHLGAPEAARATYQEAERIIDEAAPESPERSAILLNLGIAEWELGWPSRAMGWLEEAADGSRQAGDHDRAAQAEHYLPERPRASRLTTFGPPEPCDEQRMPAFRSRDRG